MISDWDEQQREVIFAVPFCEVTQMLERAKVIVDGTIREIVIRREFGHACALEFSNRFDDIERPLDRLNGVGILTHRLLGRYSPIVKYAPILWKVYVSTHIPKQLCSHHRQIFRRDSSQWPLAIPRP